jgi:methionyl aminopeptidase
LDAPIGIFGIRIKDMVLIKNYSDIRSLKEAGRIVRELLATLCQAMVPGVSTVELEILANRFLAQNRSSAPFKAFEGFNQAICISINDEIVNGPPNRERVIQTGDVVSIATAAEHRGIHAKAARTVYVGAQPPSEVERLLRGTATVIENAIHQSTRVDTLNALLQVVPETAQQYRLTVIEGMAGAGIGKKLHDAPPVPNHPAGLTEVIPLRSGFCFTLMPMFSLGESAEHVTHEDGWTFLTKDGALSAHVADTLLMTEEGLSNMTGDQG